MPANVDGMVREGISAYRAGRKEEARALLLRAVEIDEHNEQAWLWLSAVVESTDEQRICLENVLAINPANERAKQGLQVLTQKTHPAAPSPARADDVLASASFTASAAPPAKAPPSPFTQHDDEDELPSSIEWEAPPTATSSASSRQRVNEPSAEDYDDWVSSLNLGGSTSFASPAPEASNTLDAAAQFMATQFDDDDEDDDLFSLSSDVRRAATTTDEFASGPFSAGEMTSTPSRVEAPPSPPTSSSKMAAKQDSLLDEFDDEDDVADDLDLAENYDDMQLDAPETSEFFRYIPKEITATRLPGTRERAPLLLVLSLLLLIALNVGAAAWLALNLAAS